VRAGRAAAGEVMGRPEGSMEQKLGAVRVSSGVLSALIGLTATGVPGVARMSGSWWDRLLGLLWPERRQAGVRLRVREDGVHADVEIVVQQGVNMLDVAGQVQAEVTKALDRMVGIPVSAVNVHIRDVQ
jgi:uncharacterized alkaline shock family protein YloU